MRLSAARDLGLITLAGLALHAAFITAPGHVVDLQAFARWALAAADHPWNQAYEATDANYPPGALLFFELIGRAYRAVGPADPDGQVLRVFLKAPSVAFDLIGGAVSYAIARRFVDHRRALLAAAFFDLNPALVYDASLWGQNDSITAVCALAALWSALCGRRVGAWLLLAFAVLNKPPVAVLGPLLALEAVVHGPAAERAARVRATLAGLAAALSLGYLVALPFYTQTSPVAVYRRMIEWYGIGSSLYPYTSANGFNVYAFFGDFFAPDGARVLMVPIKWWADAAYLVLGAFVLTRYARRPSDRALLETAFLLMLGFFLVLTEMHERYLIYALTIAPALAAIEPRYRLYGAALTLTEWLNLEYSLTYMWLNSDNPPGVDPKEFAPVLVRLCALTNVAVFVAALRDRVRRSAEPQGTLPAPP